jgi:hypothetical protein
MDVDPDKAAWPVAIVSTILGGGGLWAWLAARTKARSSPPADMVTAAGDFAEAAAKVAEIFGDAGAVLVKALEAQLGTVRLEIEDLRAKVAECESHRDECRDDLAELRREFAAYVRDHPPADYAPTDLRRPLG